MAGKSGIFIESLEVVKEHKILFVPNMLIFLTNLISLTLFLYVSKIGTALLNNQHIILKDSLVSSKFILLFIIYMVVNALIDNFFFTAKYGMIKEVLLKKKTNLNDGWSFAKKHYWTTLWIHMLSIMIIVIPMIILVVLLLSLFPVSVLASVTIFIPLLVSYMIYITMRLLFVYPVMTFEEKGAYKSLENNFHFVKNHFSHTFATWLVVLVVSILTSIFRANASSLSSLLSGQLFFMGLLAVILIVVVELVVSVWEQVYIFDSYLSAKKRKRRKR